MGGLSHVCTQICMSGLGVVLACFQHRCHKSPVHSSSDKAICFAMTAGS